MYPATISLRPLQWTFSLLLIGALSGCHWDLFGSDSPDRTSSASPATYTVGGTVSGLASGATLALFDNGSDSLAVAANGAFRFATALAANSSYAVTVGTEPTGQTCTVDGGTGTIDAINVTSVVVTCANQAFTLGGMIQGLNGSGLVLANGGATLAVPSGAQSFSFPTAVAYGSGYSISLRTQPAGNTCVVNAGSGTMPADGMTAVVVSCTAQLFTVGGSIAGLGASLGLVLTNGMDTLNVPASAAGFMMPASVAYGAQYNVTVAANVPGETCSVTQGSGTMAAANITNVTIACKTWVESMLYSFGGPPGDGATPWYGSLVLASDGNFYGLTSAGGTHNVGTVFKVTPAGVETVLWSFGSGTDGSGPFGSLIQGHDGNLYGMTNLGGAHSYGTVFRITMAGVESVLWSFGAPNDGAEPLGSLIEGSDGNFYGETNQANGPNFDGALIRITPAGVESVLWTFGNGSDAQFPYGKLLQASDGSFLGTSYLGGTNGKGTLFRVTPAGAEAVVWSFGGSGDGAYPTGALILGRDGNYYGMAGQGGANNAGAVYRITPGGAESVIHSFNGMDAEDPAGSLLLAADGNFYGMADNGGIGSGTIFQITPSGVASLLWSLNGAPDDGQMPLGDLIVGPDGAFYGLTTIGGANNLGAVIKIK